MYWIWRNIIRKPLSLISFFRNSELFLKIERESDRQLLNKLNKKYHKNKSIIDLYKSQNMHILKEEG
jgi:hypothetical protein